MKFKNSILLILILSFFTSCRHEEVRTAQIILDLMVHSTIQISKNYDNTKNDFKEETIQTKSFKLDNINVTIIDNNSNFNNDTKIQNLINKYLIDNLLEQNIFIEQDKDLDTLIIEIDYLGDFIKEDEIWITKSIGYTVKTIDKNGNTIKSLQNSNIIFENYIKIDRYNKEDFFLELSEKILLDIKKSRNFIFSREEDNLN
ncbi:hypothetical protein AAX29_00049 [Aliarcobacter thereius]|uniref:Uncharacterized protein n=1 Tax=Aliarcobacter thereius TaxID=544718 RepID=A0A1C0B8Y0_9BACT|nr:hypothetical protein [Aliarcobacter thereius]OCM00059.1 hypothetical protein AAX29_00049 [Aliarcobacter thereius]